MRLKRLIRSVLAIGLTLPAAGCLPGLFGDDDYGGYKGPGCRIELFKLPGLQGLELPVVTDTPELTEDWHDIASVRVIYGTWRLYTERDYKGFMGDYQAPSLVSLLLPSGHLGSLQCLKRAPEGAGPPS